MPKISEDGNDVEILTAILGEFEGVSTSSSAYLRKSACCQVASGTKHTSCAKAPMHRSISNATEVREPYPMMLEGVGKRDGCLCDYLLSGLILLREEIYVEFTFA